MIRQRADLADFEVVVRDRLGLDPARAGHARLVRALGAATLAAETESPSALLQALREQPIWSAPWQAAISHLTIRETSFFRQCDWIYAIRDEILAPLIERRRSAGHRFVQVLSVGTASGEEAHTLAMLLHMLTVGSRERWRLQVVGTDLSQEALDRARLGRYRPRAIREVPSHLRLRYFTEAEGEDVQVVPVIQNLTRFGTLNLADWKEADVPIHERGYDLILCRNVLMYLTEPARNQALKKLADLLAPNGWMMLSPAESNVDISQKLKRVSLGPLLAFCRADAMPSTSPERSPEAPAPAIRAQRGTISDRAPGSVIQRPPEPETVPSRQPTQEQADAGPEQVSSGSLDTSFLLDAATNAEAVDATAKAVSLLRRVLYLEPENAEAHFRLGGLLRRTGRAEQGRRHDRTALACLSERSDEEFLRPGHEIRIRQVKKALAKRLGQGIADG
ncbi:CheR family methyltransferase [Amorphus sp. 3PC139-8]|uniref:CheR family methyltransferase n=1 Tax=Amorphus sp. 3PC139-8 TaxID=2735676 RepID=UPI00345DD4A9